MPKVVSAVEGAEVVFRLGDATHAFTGVRLWQELGLPGSAVQKLAGKLLTSG